MNIYVAQDDELITELRKWIKNNPFDPKEFNITPVPKECHFWYGLTHTKETKTKIRNHNLGKKLSKETKLKQSLANKGKIPFNKGIPNTEQQKLKISNKLSKLWEIVYPDGTVQHIKNMDKFCKENNLFKSNMYKVSYGKQKHHRGFTCKKVHLPT